MRNQPLRICDINNFFSATGGGVRRYHLEKLRVLSQDRDIEYHIVVPSDREETEIYGGAHIHHVPAPEILGNGYRFMLNPVRLRRLLKRINPDVIEVGSPYVLPDLVRIASRGLNCQIVGFWHAHYPVAYLNRPVRKVNKLLARVGERIGWWWAKRTYGKFSTTMAAARCLLPTLRESGFDQVAYTPLGVDLQQFSPTWRDEALRESWGVGPEDVVLGFPHRLCEEKNLGAVIAAYRTLRESTAHRPHLVFAGNGPGLAQVEALAGEYPEVHYLGYLSGRQEVARLLASVDVVAALSPTETFGLSAAEAMASGVALIGSDELSVGEMLRHSRCGIGVPDRDSDAIAAAWIELLKPGRARLLGARGRAYAKTHYNWTQTFERIVKVYRDVAQTSTVATRTPPLAPVATSGIVQGWGASITQLLDDTTEESMPDSTSVTSAYDSKKSTAAQRFAVNRATVKVRKTGEVPRTA